MQEPVLWIFKDRIEVHTEEPRSPEEAFELLMVWEGSEESFYASEYAQIQGEN